MTKQSGINRRFVQRGDVVEVVATVEKETLSSKDLLDTVTQLQNNVKRIDGDIKKAEMQIENLKLQKADQEKLYKDLAKHEEWANNIQESKAKSLINELVQELAQQVEAEYKPDPNTRDDSHHTMKMLQLQQRLSGDKRLQDALSYSMISKYVMTEPIFENPFKPQ